MKGLCWKAGSRTFLLPTHNAEVMMYSNCTPKGNLSLVILPSLGTKGLGLWDILSDQLRHQSPPSSYSRAMAWDCHKKAMKAELEAAPWHPLELKVLQHPSCSPQDHGQQILAASASWDDQRESPPWFGSNSADAPAAHEANHGKLSCTEGSHHHCHHQD